MVLKAMNWLTMNWRVKHKAADIPLKGHYTTADTKC